MSTGTVVPVEFDPFGEGEIERTAPATESQEEIWAAIQLGGAHANLAYNQSISLPIRGRLDHEALERSIGRVVQRHEALRATFTRDGATLCILARGPVRLDGEDLSASSDSERESRVSAARRREVTTEFELDRGPLIRFRLLTLGENSHELLITAHHIICDGWSIGVVLGELAALYGEEATGNLVEVPLPLRFGDYAIRERNDATSPEMVANEAFWLGRYQGEPPVLDLPTDRARPLERTFDAAREDFVLDRALVHGLREFGKKAGTSLAGVLLAGFEALVFRISGERAFAVGMPAAGQVVAGEHCLVGHCVHTLPIRADVDPELSFAEHVRRVKTGMLDAFDHQRFTFGTLVKGLSIPRDPSRLPLIPVLFNLDRSPARFEFVGLDVKCVWNPRAFENFEIFLSATESGDDVVFEATFNTSLFDRDTIRDRLAEFSTLLAGAVLDPTTKVADLPILPESERRTLDAWSRVKRTPLSHASIPALLEAQVRLTPDAIALRSPSSDLTYKELDERANRLARHLAARGVAPGDHVGIALSRDVNLVVALVAVLKAGGTYVPLDPDFPEARLRFIAEDARLSALISEAALASLLPVTVKLRVLVDVDAARIDGESCVPIPRKDDPDRIAYLLHTSGSTGKPKGVLVPHGAVVNFLEGMKAEPGLDAADVLVAVTTLSFDIAVLELFLPLAVGATVVVVPRDVAMDGRLLLEAITRFGATAMQATPSTWRLLLEAGFSGGEHFKALVGGEALPRDLAADLTLRCGMVWNMYGPTETTVWSTCHRVERVDGPTPIGRPIAGTEVLVLDERRRAVPIGVRGELYIGGAGVARGYLGRPELTEERFVSGLEDAADPNAVFYRTGDLVRWAREGVLMFERRADNQVKVRGYRIELGEIESVLAQDPRVRECTTVVREDTPGDLRIVAYVAVDEAAHPTIAELRKRAEQSLPAYMIPQHIVMLASLPRTPNQKIDRKSLPRPDGATQPLESQVPPRTDTERAIARIWADLLRVDDVGVTDDFFALGGHSMLATRMLARVRDAFGVELGLRRMFKAPNVAAVAEYVDATRAVPMTAAQSVRTPAKIEEIVI